MIHLLAKHYKLLLLWGVLVAVVSAGISLLFPQYYSADTKVVIISRDRAGVDPYTQTKSAELIGENLAAVMQTTDFRDKVIAAKTEVFQDTSWSNLTERNFRKKWIKDVQGRMVYGANLLQVTAYGRTPAMAVALADVVSQTVVTNGWEYIGGDVAIKRVDSPLSSRFPTRPNFVLNAVVGFCIGILLAGLWIVRYKHRGLLGNG